MMVYCWPAISYTRQSVPDKDSLHMRAYVIEWRMTRVTAPDDRMPRFLRRVRGNRDKRGALLRAAVAAINTSLSLSLSLSLARARARSNNARNSILRGRLGCGCVGIW
jgi:hypothetical protein